MSGVDQIKPGPGYDNIYSRPLTLRKGTSS